MMKFSKLLVLVSFITVGLTVGTQAVQAGPLSGKWTMGADILRDGKPDPEYQPNNMEYQFDFTSDKEGTTTIIVKGNTPMVISFPFYYILEEQGKIRLYLADNTPSKIIFDGQELKLGETLNGNVITQNILDGFDMLQEDHRKKFPIKGTYTLDTQAGTLKINSEHVIFDIGAYQLNKVK